MATGPGHFISFASVFWQGRSITAVKVKAGNCQLSIINCQFQIGPCCPGLFGLASVFWQRRPATAVKVADRDAVVSSKRMYPVHGVRAFRWAKFSKGVVAGRGYGREGPGRLRGDVSGRDELR